ncbi:Ig-like domain-containing protein [Deinococcus cellulosilyticus]|uniref:Ig-like domain-containing protein n=2 Tax=Deinococcus cellulosilyticus TaxID=401558 RepID=UPI0036D23987
MTLLLAACNSFTPDLKAPTLTVSGPSENAVIATSSVEVSGTITDDFKVASASYTLNGGPAQSITVNKNGSFKINLTGLTEQAYTLVITARDAAGNEKSFTVHFTVQFADVTAPSITVTAPTEGATVTGTSTAITGKITDNRAVQSASISVNGGAAQPLTLGADGSFSFTQNNLNDGNYSVSITAKDTSGNEKTVTSSFKVVLPDLFEPNNTFDQATVLVAGQTTGKAIIDGSDRDVDWYKFEGKAGQQVKIEVLTQSAFPDSMLDSIVYLYPPIINDATTFLAVNDDADPLQGTDMGSQLVYTFADDSTYYIKVVSARVDGGLADNNAKNTYKLRLSLLNEGALK